MLTTTLKNSFNKYFDAPIAAWEEFAAYCEPINFKKDECIKKADTSEKYFYFILSGSAGIFLWKENNFVCLDFAFDHSFCGDYMSIITKSATPLEVVVLEASRMVRISVDSFEN